MRGKMGDGEMGDDRGMMMEVDGVWKLDRMGILSCIRVSIGM